MSSENIKMKDGKKFCKKKMWIHIADGGMLP